MATYTLDLTVEDIEEKPLEKEASEWKPTPIATVHPEEVDTSKIRLFKEPEWILRMTIEGDRSYTRVKVVHAAPLTQPDRYFCILDIKDEAICLVTDLSDLPEESRPLVHEELDKRYLTAEVQKIVALQNEYGVTYWTVETDRGRREFVAKSVAENAQWLSETRLMIFDVDGNRFEVPDMKALDRKSQDLLGSVL
jgi:hypothetical protein